MDAMEVTFAGEPIRVEESRVVVGKDSFNPADIGRAEVVDKFRFIKVSWKTPAIMLSSATLLGLALGGYYGYTCLPIDLWIVKAVLALLGSVQAGAVGAFAGLAGGVVVGDVTGHKTIEEQVRTFRILDKEGNELLALRERYTSEEREFFDRWEIPADLKHLEKEINRSCCGFPQTPAISPAE